MKTLQQRYIRPDGTDYTVTHIYSEEGHFEKGGLFSGIHIQLGSNDTADSYVEVSDGVQHDVPDSLPDVILPEEPEEDPADIEDYQAALEELGVQINDEA